MECGGPLRKYSLGGDSRATHGPHVFLIVKDYYSFSLTAFKSVTGKVIKNREHSSR